MVQSYLKIKPVERHDASKPQQQASALIGDLMRLSGAAQAPHGALRAPK
jgi:hypothetical protein